jgi:hypothetical protein
MAQTPNPDVARLERMVEDIRGMRNRLCDPKASNNPRYHALSMAVSSLMKAADDLRREDQVRRLGPEKDQ